MPFADANIVDFSESHNVKSDLYRFDSANLWNVIYERLKNTSTLVNKDASCNAARSVNNRWKNRYRDISPYDDNRVVLCSSFDGDYINASYVSIPEAPMRRYILTQGPMQQTVSHFWLMVWESRSPMIVMLNRIYEKGIMRCFPYFPHIDGPSFLTFMDVGLRVRLEHETNMQFFVHRTFEITHIHSSEQHHVAQMHYINWPDFGVPGSPSGMLNFLWAVRATGALSDPVHPVIVHCSAGVGRSGAFVLIDLALYMIEEQGSIDKLDLSRLFLDLRRCRMGVIQTSDQLRFCYSAVARGADELLHTPKDQIPYIQFKPKEDEDKQPAECSESDDSWEGLDKVGSDSSVGQFTDSEAELDLNGFPGMAEKRSEDKEEEEELELLDGVQVDEIRRRRDQFDEPFGSAVHKNSWLPVELRSETSLLRSSFGVGPGSQENESAWNRRRVNASPCGLPQEPAMSEDFFIRSYITDQSNNAISSESPVLFPEAPQPPSYSHAMETAESDPVGQDPGSNPDGDNASIVRSEQLTMSTALLENLTNGDDSVNSEYLAAAYDLIQRRQIRRERQARIRERIEQTRRRMRELDLERKRWLPQRLLRIFRRFYAESGWVQSRYSAAASTTICVLIVAVFSRLAFNYWRG